MGGAALLSQLLGGAAGKVGDGFLKIAQLGHWMTKGPGTGDFFLGGGCVVQINTGCALQFTNRAFQHH